MKKFLRFLREWKFLNRRELGAAFRSFSGVRLLALQAATVLAIGLFFAIIISVSNRFATQVPVVGGSISEGVLGTPRFINPVLAVSDTDRSIVELVYSGLTKRLPDGTIIPDLAERYTISDDKRTYTFILREDAVFHDGTPVTSEDVRYTISQIQNPSIQSPKRANWTGISIAAPDPKTVIFTLEKPYSSFLDTTTIGILPAHLWEETTPDTFGFLTLNTEPVGSGPFRFSSMEKKRNGIPISYTFVRFPRYALGGPYLKSIKLMMYGNQNELREAVANGDVGQAAALSAADIESIGSDEVTLQSTILPRVFGMFLNPARKALFADREMVRLIDEAIDKDALVTEVFGTHASITNGPVPFQPIISEGLSMQEKDVEALKAEFTKRGWTLGSDGLLQKQGVPLTFSLATAETPELVMVANTIRDQLSQYGIIVDLKIYNLSTLTQDIIQPRNFDAVLFGHVIETEADLYAFWHSSQRNFPGLNITQYANPRSDSLLEAILGAISQETVLQNLALFDVQVRNDHPAVFLYLPHFLYVTDSKVKGVELERMASPSDRFLGVHQWYKETEPVWNIFIKE